MVARIPTLRPPGVPSPLWWSLKLVHYADELGITGMYSELDPPPGYDPYTGKVDGSFGPFATEGGDVLYTDDTLEGRRATLVFTRAIDDVEEFSLTLLNLTGGVPDSTWTAGDYTAAEARIDTLWGAIKSRFPVPVTLSSGITLSAIKWHRWGVGIGRPNPVEHETARSVAGTGAGPPLPAQVASTITFKTSRRRSWGRVYLPAGVEGQTDGDGRMSPAVQSQFLTAFGNLADGLKADQTPLVVWCPRKAGAILKVTGTPPHLEIADASSFALTVDQIQVDNVWDVQRRRRLGTATSRTTHTV